MLMKLSQVGRANGSYVSMAISWKDINYSAG